MLHDARTAKKLRKWKEIHLALRKLKIVSMSFTFLIKILKKFDNKTAVLLNSSDGKCLVMRRGRKIHIGIQDATRKIHYSAHNHISLVIYLVMDPIKEVKLVLNSTNVNGIENDNINYNFDIVISSRSISPNYSNLSICNDSNVGLFIVSNTLLKSQSKLISSES